RFEAVSDALSLDDRKLGKGRKRAKPILRDLGRLRKRAGKVRDMDVLTQFATTLHPRSEEECTVELLEHLGVERNRQAGKLAATADSPGSSLRADLKPGAFTLASMLEKTKGAANQDGGAADSAANAEKMAFRLGTPRRLGRSNLHPWHLQVKE